MEVLHLFVEKVNKMSVSKQMVFKNQLKIIFK